ncbi:MAG: HD domain-containing protein [Zoogloeaceae bacterium]|jgi:HD-GYP domain-containing protein (c-di-GMP phosphodiesterase class II)|nr:HD domain-containing protein [Zoogloeaceae bacterium]
MDIKEIIAPVIQDREILEEFSDSLQDKAVEIAYHVGQLKKTPGNQDLAGRISRALHTIKGEAAATKLELGVAITHHIEALFGRFRDGSVPFSEVFAEALLLALDRLELAVENLLRHTTLEDLKLVVLLQELEKTSRVPPDQVNAVCGEMIEAVTGFPSVVSADEIVPESRPPVIDNQDVAADLQFFRSFALQLENRSPFFKGRTNRILRLALEANKAAESPVDPVQLEAAIYMHDVGMLLLPERTWLKVGHLSAEDRLALRGHTSYGAGLLQRIPGWNAAAEMVAQHHEMHDGSGYPANLKGEDISPGAKIIAIVDAFEAVMLKHSHRGKNRSVLRAIAEINACDNQFAPEWTLPFNQVIKRTIGAS